MEQLSIILTELEMRLDFTLNRMYVSTLDETVSVLEIFVFPKKYTF